MTTTTTAITDHYGHTVSVINFDPPNGDPSTVVVAVFDTDDKRPTLALTLRPDMALRLAYEISVLAEAQRRFEMEKS